MSFHTTYRPANLKQIIGHTAIVARLKGIVKEKKYPSAMLFIGPTSAGKTTLARAFAADVNGVTSNIESHPDYNEINAGVDRSLESVKSLTQTAKYKPRTKKRFIVIDEAQQLIGNAPAAAALLKPLEEPSKDTIWILCSMDPDKFTSGNGKAIANRCTQFVLNPHSDEELLKQAVRIAKAEDMKYVMDEERVLLKEIVSASNGEMRTLANQLESVQQYYNGLSDKPKKIKKSEIATVVSSTSSSDDKVAVLALAAVYNGQFKVLQRCILDAQDYMSLIIKMTYLNTFCINTTVLEGARHNKVWGSKAGNELMALVKKNKVTLGTLAATNEALVEARAAAMMAGVSVDALLSARMYRLIKQLFSK